MNSRTKVTREKFDLIKKFKGVKSVKEIQDISSLSRSTIYNTIKKIDEFNDPTFEKIYMKVGRKKMDKSSIHCEIRSFVGNDNSLTQKGVGQKLSKKLSKSQLSREFKNAGLSRKRFKKASNVRLTENNILKRQQFCSNMLTKIGDNILFLDEAGFNLHTSTNYGYSPVNKDAVLYQPASRGRNLSLCAIISKNGIKKLRIKGRSL